QPGLALAGRFSLEGGPSVVGSFKAIDAEGAPVGEFGRTSTLDRGIARDLPAEYRGVAGAGLADAVDVEHANGGVGRVLRVDDLQLGAALYERAKRIRGRRRSHGVTSCDRYENQ